MFSNDHMLPDFLLSATFRVYSARNKYLDCVYNNVFTYTFIRIFLGDEMFSDAYKIKLVDDVLYEVYGKVNSRTCAFIISHVCDNLMSGHFF